MNDSSRVSFLAPAKLNISLAVFGKRSDGLHNIRSVMVPVSLYDQVTVEEAPAGIRVESDDPAVPSGSGNTCYKAAKLFMEWAGAPRGVRIVVKKRIPAEAGLGGGSSDAAATLKGLMALSGATPPREALLAMAASVGADVPFFTVGGPALVEGSGERLTPLPWTVPFFALIVKPPFGLPTAEGYRRLGRAHGEPPPAAESPAVRNWTELVSSVGNDFEEAWAVERPEIGAIKRELVSEGAAVAGMSGSGSAVFGLFEGEATAREAQGALSRRGAGGFPGGGRRSYLARNV